LDVYTLYIEDDRYSTPTIDFLPAADEAHARGLAAARLASSPHYLAVEVWSDERLVFRLSDPSEPPLVLTS
jgi:hypothetical protein